MFSIMSFLVCTLIYINKVIVINIIKELLRYIFSNSLPIIGSMNIGLKLPKSL